MTTQKRAGIYQDRGGWVRVVFPFDRGVSDTLKGLVGRGNYHYDGTARSWYVLEPFAQDAVNVLLANGYQVETDLPGGATPAAPPPATSNGSNPFKLLFAMTPAGLDMKVHTALLKVLHPDAGGSTWLMQLLNVAWDEHQVLHSDAGGSTWQNDLPF